MSKYKNLQNLQKKGQNRFKKLSKFEIFQLSNFTLTRSNEEKMNSIQLDMTHSKRITAKKKNEYVGEIYSKNLLYYTIIVKYCVIALFRNNNRFLMGMEGSLSQKGIIKVYQKLKFNPRRLMKSLLYNIHSEGNKKDTN